MMKRGGEYAMDRIEVDKMKAMVSQIVSEEANQKLERE